MKSANDCLGESADANASGNTDAEYAWMVAAQNVLVRDDVYARRYQNKSGRTVRNFAICFLVVVLVPLVIYVVVQVIRGKF